MRRETPIFEHTITRHPHATTLDTVADMRQLRGIMREAGIRNAQRTRFSTTRRTITLKAYK